MKRQVLFIVTMLLLVAFSTAFAETKTFIKEYTYQASEDDSRNSSRTIALREVKRLLLEELGTYLESITEVQNFQLTKDQITTLTAGIVQTEIVEEKWDGHTYWLKSKIAADSGDVIKSIDALRKDRQKTKELEDLRKRSDELLKENERLRKELAMSMGEKRQGQKADYDKNVKELSAFEWLEKGLAYVKSHNFKAAIDAFNKAIEIDSTYAYAYNNRGFAYYELGNYKKAINNYDRGIKLDPGLSIAYNNRGLAYTKLGNYKKAINDYDRGIKLDPKYEGPFFLRGVVYAILGNYNQAVKDFDKTIELNPKYAKAYSARGLAYKKLGNYNKAIKDYDKAIELDPKDADVYLERANVHAKYRRPQAIEDMKMAARLGDKKAQNILRQYKIDWTPKSLSKITSQNKPVQIQENKAGPSVSNDKPAQKPEKKAEPSSSATSPDNPPQKPVKNVETSTVADDPYKKIKAIVLMNGNVIEGKILSWNPDIVKIRTKHGKVSSYDFKKEVQTFITE